MTFENSRYGEPFSFKLRIIEVDVSSAWKVSKYGVLSGPYFPVFGLNTGKYGPEKTSYLNTFHAVFVSMIIALVTLTKYRQK